jgi:hypothetical protein
MNDKAQIEELRAQLAEITEKLGYVRSLGTVYVYPSGWNCAKQGGHPPIEAYETVDLSEV